MQIQKQLRSLVGKYKSMNNATYVSMNKAALLHCILVSFENGIPKYKYLGHDLEELFNDFKTKVLQSNGSTNYTFLKPIGYSEAIINVLETYNPKFQKIQ